MEKFNKFLGIAGVVLFIFGVVSFLIAGEFNIYNEFHLIGGLILIIYYAAVDFSSLLEGIKSRSVKYGAGTFIYGIIIFAIIVIINLIAYKVPKRWDLTANKIYSLSPESKKVANMVPKGTVILAFFEGGNAGAVEDLLKTYDYASDKLTYEIVDPEKHPELAEKYQVNRDKTIVVVYKNRFFKATENTEQGITNALLKLVKGQHKKIYFLTDHGEHSITDDSAQGYSILKKALQDDNFEVEEFSIARQGKIPSDASLIVVAGPTRAYLPQELQVITDYLKNGGAAIFMVDPMQDDLKPYIQKWGVILDDDVIIDRSVKLFGGPQLGVFPIVKDYGIHPITKGMDGKSTIFPLARSLEKYEPPRGVTGATFFSGLKVTSIAKTSSQSWGETNLKELFEKHVAEIDSNDKKGPLSVAMVVEKELSKGNTGKGEQQSSKKKEVKLVVVGNSSFVTNKFIQSFYNMDFFLNMVNWLAGESEFVTIRPKSVKYSRVNFTEEQMATMFYLSVLIIPELLILLGLFVWVKRR